MYVTVHTVVLITHYNIESEENDMNEQKMKLDKVKKSCRTTRKVVNVFKVLFIVCAVVCFLGAALCGGFRKQIDRGIQTSIEKGYGTFETDDLEIHTGIISMNRDFDDFIENGNYALVCIIYCIFGGVLLTILTVIFSIIANIFKDIENSESPFTPSVLSKIRKMFIALVIIMGLSVGIGLAVMLGLILWCVYCIMDYGAALQIEVDETL